MANYNTEKLQFYLNSYIKDLPSFWDDEKYKWEAVQCFQKNWDIENADFGQMLKIATRKHLNLLASGMYYPLGVLQEFIEIDQERVRNMFQILYDESKDIVERITYFQSEAESIRVSNSERWKNHYQDIRAISVFLWMRYPEKYYIFKYKEFSKTRDRIELEYSLRDSSNPKSYVDFLEVMDMFCSVIKQNNNLKHTLISLLQATPDAFPDNQFHIATVDFVFYVGKRFQPNSIEEKEENNENNQEMNTSIKEQFRAYLSNCVQTRRQTGTSFIISKTTVDSYVSFAETDKLFDYDPNQWSDISSIYEIVSSKRIKDIIERLFNDGQFAAKDSSGTSQYFRSNAIKQYYCFLKARELFSQEDSAQVTTLFDSNLPLQQIFYGAPGTGKSHEIKKLTTGQKVFRTTFHPDSDYSTFVGCYKPTMRAVADKYKAVAGKDEEITYSFVPQAFLQAYIAAWNDIEKPVFLVIEEINRGNCAQIFGDLFQLLDRDDEGYSEYPIMADQDLAKYLNGKDENGQDVLTNKDGIKDGKLSLPKNLHIWATMNTSDQSLFPIDSAFKRRWEWRYLKIKDMGKGYQIEADGKKYDWWKFVEKMNGIIGEATSSEDKKLGYFFAKPDKADNIVAADQFVSKVLFYVYGDALKDYQIKDDAFKKSNDGDKMTYYEFSDFYNESGKVEESIIAAILDKFVGTEPTPTETNETEQP